jgi:membrane-bound serine protease (ClpP class)
MPDKSKTPYLCNTFMTLSLILTILIVGFILIGIEIFVTPGFVVGLIGFGFLAVGVYLSYTGFEGNLLGHITLSVTGIILVAGIIFTFKSDFWKRIALKDEISARAFNATTLTEGEIGRSISTLRLSGTGLFDGRKYEVWSEGGIIESQTEIIVSKIIDNKIFVKPLNK